MSLATPHQFQVDTNDVLGFSYGAYISSVTALSLSNPGQYHALRASVLKSVKTEAVKDLYNTIFNILNKGTTVEGQTITAGTGLATLGQAPYIPGYPSQKINDIALLIARDMSDHLDDVVDIILPHNFERLASAALSLKGRASVLN